MLVDHMLCTIDGAQSIELARVGSDISRAYGNGALSEDDYQRLWEAIEARRALDRLAAAGRRKGSPRRPARPRQPRSPERQASIARRRRLSVVAMPPHLAAHFTTSELSALLIIGSEAVAHGCCTLYVETTAARAGCKRTTVQNAIRQARRLGLIEVRERRRRGQKSLTNVIRIISKEWRLWLTRGGGFKKTNTTVTSTNKPEQTTGPEGFGARWQAHHRHYASQSSGATARSSTSSRSSPRSWKRRNGWSVEVSRSLACCRHPMRSRARAELTRLGMVHRMGWVPPAGSTLGATGRRSSRTF
jgi:hypothetical protein